MRFRLLILGFGWVLPGALHAQTDTMQVHRMLQQAKRAARYATDSLHLNTGKRFFEPQRDSTGAVRLQQGMNYYVYASRRDTVKSALAGAYRWFGTDSAGASRFGDSCRKARLDVLVYRTAGTASAKLNVHMLDYADRDVIFLVLHEAIHRHRNHVKSKLPYPLEEALCDFTANTFVPDVLGYGHGHKVREVFGLNWHEFMYHQLNLTLAREQSKRRCSRHIRNHIHPPKLNRWLSGSWSSIGAFFEDRYLYRVNNAYLLRYRDYTWHYFLIKDLYNACKNREEFYTRMFSLSGTEEEAVKQIRIWVDEGRR